MCVYFLHRMPKLIVEEDDVDVSDDPQVSSLAQSLCYLYCNARSRLAL